MLSHHLSNKGKIQTKKQNNTIVDAQKGTSGTSQPSQRTQKRDAKKRKVPTSQEFVDSSSSDDVCMSMIDEILDRYQHVYVILTKRTH